MVLYMHSYGVSPVTTIIHNASLLSFPQYGHLKFEFGLTDSQIIVHPLSTECPASNSGIFF